MATSTYYTTAADGTVVGPIVVNTVTGQVVSVANTSQTAPIGTTSNVSLQQNLAVVGNITAGNIIVSANVFAQSLLDSGGSVRTTPRSGSADKTTSYTLTGNDVGRFIGIGVGGSITVPTGVFVAGNTVTILNNQNSTCTITCSALTTYIAGSNTVKTSLTLAVRGIATVFFTSASSCIVTGSVS